MGKIANRMRRGFERALRTRTVSLTAFREAKEKAAQELKSIPEVSELLDSGYQPAHAVYVHTLNLVSLFAEQAVTLPPLHKAHDFLKRTEDLYWPGYPPKSPVTKSYFNHWVFFDVHFGADRETIGSCFVSLAGLLSLHPLQREAARNLCRSRMGVYQVTGKDSGDFRLREFVTNHEIDAVIPSGFDAPSGTLIYVRLAPPLDNSANRWTALTTPYLLLDSQEDWLEYFKRHEIMPGTVGAEARMSRHMKSGPSRTHWSEFVFYGYVNHRPDTILLAGFPDRTETQPCHDEFDRRTFQSADRRAASFIESTLTARI